MISLVYASAAYPFGADVPHSVLTGRIRGEAGRNPARSIAVPSDITGYATYGIAEIEAFLAAQGRPR
jgi:hypothetical protein